MKTIKHLQREGLGGIYKNFIETKLGFGTK